MSPPTEKAPRALEDFLGILRELTEAGADFVVIGGCAVGAYAALVGERVLSGDLDLLTSSQELEEILAWAPREGVVIRKRPQPRSIPVAFLEWDGEEVNILTSAVTMPDADAVLDRSRRFESSPGGLEIPIADPYQLLRNKRAANRPKDRPHIEVLRRFIAREVVDAFEEETDPVLRLQPARYFLKAEDLERLPRPLFDEIASKALQASDLPFLSHRAPDEQGLRTILEAGKELGDTNLQGKLARIAAARE